MKRISAFKEILSQYTSEEEAMKFWQDYRKSKSYDEDFEKYITKHYNHYYVESDINGYIIAFYLGNIRGKGEII